MTLRLPNRFLLLTAVVTLALPPATLPAAAQDKRPARTFKICALNTYQLFSIIRDFRDDVPLSKAQVIYRRSRNVPRLYKVAQNKGALAALVAAHIFGYRCVRDANKVTKLNAPFLEAEQKAYGRCGRGHAMRTAILLHFRKGRPRQALFDRLAGRYHRVVRALERLRSHSQLRAWSASARAHLLCVRAVRKRYRRKTTSPGLIPRQPPPARNGNRGGDREIQ